MQWSDLTVQQYQQIMELCVEERDALDKTFDLIGICFNLTTRQVDSLSAEEIKGYSRGLAFLSQEPEWKPVPQIVVDGRHYRLIYDVRQIRAARNIEVKHYGAEGLIPNLHKVAASMVMPQRQVKRRGLWGWLRFGEPATEWIDDEYDAAKHEQYAADIRQAPVMAVYGSALFFCHVFRQLITDTADYLTSTIPETKRAEARQLLLDSCSSLAGSTMPQASQPSNASP